jgi:hypothetical protein
MFDPRSAQQLQYEKNLTLGRDPKETVWLVIAGLNHFC